MESLNPQMSPQALAVLKVLEQRMGAPQDAPASFNDRFMSFEGKPVDVMPHEIQYGMSQAPYDKKVVDDLFGQQPKMPDFPGMNEFIQPGQDNSMEDMMGMFFGG